MNAIIAYCGAAPTPAELLGSWNLDPVLLAMLAGATLWLARTPTLAAGGRRVALGGVGVLFVLFTSPLCAATSALFSARVVHHLLLIAAAAPLFALAIPRGRVPAVGAGAALALHAATFWLWHLPGLYAAALASVAGYWLMQATLLGSAVLFWHATLRGPRVPGLLALVAAVAQMGLLGALLTFAARPLYAAHLLSTQAWRLSPLADQQLAGLLMWVPALLPYAAAGAWMLRDGAIAVAADAGATRRAGETRA